MYHKFFAKNIQGEEFGVFNHDSLNIEFFSRVENTTRVKDLVAEWTG